MLRKYSGNTQEILGSHHPANRPEYFTADEYSQPSSYATQFPRTLGLTQILGGEQVLRSEQQAAAAPDLSLGGPLVNPQSDYLAAVQYLQPQVMTMIVF